MKRKRERKKHRILTFAGGMYVGSVGKYGLGVIDGIENAVTLLLRDRCVCIRGPQCQEREVQSDAAKEADRP